MLRFIYTIRRWFGFPATAAEIQTDPDWDRTRRELRWTFVKETQQAVQIRQELGEQYKNMETAETATLIREDTKFEWFEWNDEWPPYAEEAYKNGTIWKSDIEQPCPSTSLKDILKPPRLGYEWKRVE